MAETECVLFSSGGLAASVQSDLSWLRCLILLYLGLLPLLLRHRIPLHGVTKSLMMVRVASVESFPPLVAKRLSALWLFPQPSAFANRFEIKYSSFFLLSRIRILTLLHFSLFRILPCRRAREAS